MDGAGDLFFCNRTLYLRKHGFKGMIEADVNRPTRFRALQTYSRIGYKIRLIISVCCAAENENEVASPNACSVGAYSECVFRCPKYAASYLATKNARALGALRK